MRISEIGEFGLIRRIGKGFSRPSSRVAVGIGDDAAALLCSPSSALLATTDMLIEGVHFDLAYTDFFSLGWKSAAANLSDIAAMGGTPRFCLAALGLPDSVAVEDVAAFYRGLMALLRRHGTDLVGGDTCRSGKGLIVSITILGEAGKKQMVLRSGARAGDRIFVTGTLGDSAAGLEIMKRGSGTRGQGTGRTAGRSPGPGTKKLIERHLRPVPRLEEGRAVALSRSATAMIDVSDGLSSDLGHICEESGVGAEVHEDRIPLSPALRRAGGLRERPVRYALTGGEDYELLFTVPPSKTGKLAALGIAITEIGVITKRKQVRLVAASGSRTLLVPTGYDHFRRRK
jgi:thiamine-monophosphate kinase